MPPRSPNIKSCLNLCASFALVVSLSFFMVSCSTYEEEAVDDCVVYGSVQRGGNEEAVVKLVETVEEPVHLEETTFSQSDIQIVENPFDADNKREVLDVSDLLKSLEEEVEQQLNVPLEGRRITLAECIHFALRDNEAIEKAFLDRENQLMALKVSEDEFRLKGTLSLAALNYKRTHNRDSPHSTSVGLPAPSITLTQRIKTGGEFTFNWTNSYSYSKDSGQPGANSASSSASLEFKQPLLRGGGFDIATLSLTNAYLQEEANILNLKSVLINTVTSVIKFYRSYYLAIEQYEIDKRALLRARESFRKTKVMFDAGKQAETDVVERRRDLAQKEFDFEDRKDSLEKARLDLLRVMNMDTNLKILPAGITLVELETENLPALEEILGLAYVNDPEYLTQLISYRQAELAYLKAKDDLLWDLNFNAGIQSTAQMSNSLAFSNDRTWDFRDKTLSAGLTLTIPVFNDHTREQGIISSRIAIKNAQIDLRSREEEMIRTFKDTVRTIEKNILQLKLSKITTALTRKRLEQKRIELDAGKVEQFEYTDAQDRLRDAENAEIQTQINYMNSLADLDQQLGTTLDTWGIDIKRRLERMPRLDRTLFISKVKDNSQ